MKVALCLSGLPRTWKKTYPFLKKHILDHYDVDIFLHTWYENTPLEHEELISVYRPKKFCLDKNNCIILPKEYERADAPGVANKNSTYKNIFSMYKSIWISNCTKIQFESENNFKYDWVVRLRFDYLLDYEINLSEKNKNLLYIPIQHIHHGFNANSEYPVLVCDQFAFSKSSIMDMYSGTYLNIDEFYSHGDKYKHLEGGNIEKVMINGEHLLAMQLRKCLLNKIIKYIPYKFPSCLLRE